MKNLDQNNFKIEALNQYQYLFPDQKLLAKFNKVNNVFAKAAISAFLIFMGGAIVIGVLTIVLKDEIKYLFFNISFYLLAILYSAVLLLFHWPKRKLLKLQYQLLLKSEMDFQNEILLHKNYSRYQLKWSCFYAIILFIASFLSFSLFISDLIRDKNTSLAPVFVLMLFLVLLIPVMVANYYCFKNFRKRQRKIEEKIDSSNN
ncbi:MAG: hypothetical protein RBS76_05170 [Acholeplasmatales bacterium]|jgi:MFS family permease|nr:hypothetical protein [Acholeplasmataceae bacterium]MDY0115867.1 hypothetical protein [Acholeplasmatales bacterium]